jgi:RNA 2',3'-cyclic 3'-phosphodiesterase
MRLFVALPVPAPAREQIAEVLARLRATDWPVRWVNADLLHVTLKFFGEVAPERYEVIAEALRYAAVGAAPMSLRLEQLGAFPSARHPRVLWVGLDAPPALELLQDRLERGFEAIGFPPEGAPFKAHVTLGRVREGQRLPPHALESEIATVKPVACLAKELVLYESLLTPDGPRYTPRLTLALEH